MLTPLYQLSVFQNRVAQCFFLFCALDPYWGTLSVLRFDVADEKTASWAHLPYSHYSSSEDLYGWEQNSEWICTLLLRYCFSTVDLALTKILSWKMMNLLVLEVLWCLPFFFLQWLHKGLSEKWTKCLLRKDIILKAITYLD